jgi:hypothetical protein
MAIETNDLLVLQKNGGGELRKATVSALLAQVAGPNLDDYLQKPGVEGDFIISEAADGTITYSETIDGGFKELSPGEIDYPD